MKRTARKLGLARETIKHLRSQELQRVAGQKAMSRGDMHCDSNLTGCMCTTNPYCGSAPTFIGCSDACPTFRYDCL